MGVLDGHVECGLGETGGDCGDAEPAGVEGAEGDRQPLALCADEAVGVQHDAVPVHAGGRDRIQSHLSLRLAEGEAIRLARRQEGGDAVAAGACAREQDVEAGLAAVGDPGLGPGDAVAALWTVDPLGAAAEGRRVGPGLGLGEAVAADQLAAQHPRQPLAPLAVGAEVREREARHDMHAGRGGDRRPAGGELLEHLQIDLVRLASAALVLRVRQPEQAEPAHLREQAVGVDLVPLGLVDDRRELAVGEVANQVDEVVRLLGGEQTVDGHRTPSSRRSNCTQDDTRVQLPRPARNVVRWSWAMRRRR